MRITKKQLRNLIQEAMPRGGAPDMVGYLNKGRPDPIVDAMIDDYEDFVEREGHITRASSSVAASFFMQDPERRDDHDAHQNHAIDHEHPVEIGRLSDTPIRLSPTKMPPNFEKDRPWLELRIGPWIDEHLAWYHR